MFANLNEVQTNVLIASIIGDGELTKLYKGSRRKNSSYREHYGKNQKAYREWKADLMGGLFYITAQSQTLRSGSNPLFTQLLKLFYVENGAKTIPKSMLDYCKLNYFLAVLYMDDGTLSITHRVNHINKKIYLTPQIYLYLQNYTSEDLTLLKNHIKNAFEIHLHLASRKDGNGLILRTTSVKQTFLFLNKIENITKTCPSMYYKTNWFYRLKQEKVK
ncbi:DNA endonuclease [Heyndrickxia sporothermodurans]|uniref:DNA endonuclease n=1 Tax=Heyndrickxia sporothermodurans TaxID=46224 RepID=UPI001F230AE6|nr:DNA endonuclease [Heyndrickxia sporothermodurans]